MLPGSPLSGHEGKNLLLLPQLAFGGRFRDFILCPAFTMANVSKEHDLGHSGWVGLAEEEGVRCELIELMNGVGEAKVQSSTCSCSTPSLAHEELFEMHVEVAPDRVVSPV